MLVPDGKSVAEQDGDAVFKIDPEYSPSIAWHLPLHRQAQMLASCGVIIDLGTLGAWVTRVASWLELLYDALLAFIRSQPRVFCDETPLPRLDPGRKRTKLCLAGREELTTLRDARLFLDLAAQACYLLALHRADECRGRPGIGTSRLVLIGLRHEQRGGVREIHMDRDTLRDCCKALSRLPFRKFTQALCCRP